MATEIIAYLKNGDILENAAAMIKLVATCATKLHNCRPEEISFDEVERIPL